MTPGDVRHHDDIFLMDLRGRMRAPPFEVGSEGGQWIRIPAGS